MYSAHDAFTRITFIQCYHVILTVLDLLLCLCVLKHRAPLVIGAHLPANNFLRWVFAYVMQY